MSVFGLTSCTSGFGAYVKNLLVLTLVEPGIMSTVMSSDRPIFDASAGGVIIVALSPDLKKTNLINQLLHRNSLRRLLVSQSLNFFDCKDSHGSSSSSLVFFSFIINLKVILTLNVLMN